MDLPPLRHQPNPWEFEGRIRAFEHYLREYDQPLTVDDRLALRTLYDELKAALEFQDRRQ